MNVLWVFGAFGLQKIPSQLCFWINLVASVINCFLTTGFMVSLGPRNRFRLFSIFIFCYEPFWPLQEWNYVAKGKDFEDFVKVEKRRWTNSHSSLKDIIIWELGLQPQQ